MLLYIEGCIGPEAYIVWGGLIKKKFKYQVEYKIMYKIEY